jgi:hypothetical protein
MALRPGTVKTRIRVKIVTAIVATFRSRLKNKRTLQVSHPCHGFVLFIQHWPFDSRLSFSHQFTLVPSATMPTDFPGMGYLPDINQAPPTVNQACFRTAPDQSPNISGSELVIVDRADCCTALHWCCTAAASIWLAQEACCTAQIWDQWLASCCSDLTAEAGPHRQRRRAREPSQTSYVLSVSQWNSRFEESTR